MTISICNIKRQRITIKFIFISLMQTIWFLSAGGIELKDMRLLLELAWASKFFADFFLSKERELPFSIWLTFILSIWALVWTVADKKSLLLYVLINEMKGGVVKDVICQKHHTKQKWFVNLASQLMYRKNISFVSWFYIASIAFSLFSYFGLN